MRTHPHFIMGWNDAREGAILLRSANAMYRKGWKTYKKVRKILEKAGVNGLVLPSLNK